MSGGVPRKPQTVLCKSLSPSRLFFSGLWTKGLASAFRYTHSQCKAADNCTIRSHIIVKTVRDISGVKKFTAFSWSYFMQMCSIVLASFSAGFVAGEKDEVGHHHHRYISWSHQTRALTYNTETHFFSTQREQNREGPWGTTAVWGSGLLLHWYHCPHLTEAQKDKFQSRPALRDRAKNRTLSNTKPMNNTFVSKVWCEQCDKGKSPF